MSSITFEAAISERVGDMLDACTACGKCYEVCPITAPAGISAKGEEVIAGVLDIVRTGEGPDASRLWANSCVLSGECIKACDYGVNPRFLLTMARVAMTKAKSEPFDRRKLGVENFRKMSHGATVLPRMQLDDALLERLGQRTSKPAADRTQDGAEVRPDFVFYTGCNVLKTPHIALLALDVMDALGVTYTVMGGPSHCCGVIQLRTGDLEASGSMAFNTIEKLNRAKNASKNSQVLSWCPSCQVQFNETTLPAYARAKGSRPFEMTPFMLFLRTHLDRLRPLLTLRVEMRIALHRHPGIPGVVRAAEDILNVVPGVELVDLGQPAVGLMSNALAAMPAYKRDLQRAELEAARDAGVDALVAVYHADHRELCAHERDFPFQIVNLLEIVGASMGLHQTDVFKRLKKMQDVDLIVSECGDLIAAYGLSDDNARKAVKAMLDEQPLPLTEGGNGLPDRAAPPADG